MPTAEGIRRTLQLYVAAWSRHDVDAVTALLDSDAVVHDPVDCPALEGTDAIRE